MNKTHTHPIRTRSSRVLHKLGRALTPHPKSADRFDDARRSAMQIQQAQFNSICR